MVESVAVSAVTVVDETISAAVHMVGVTGTTAADVVGHKYGSEVRKSAETCSDILVSTAQTAANWNQLGVKAMAKRVAADMLDSDSEGEADADGDLRSAASSAIASARSAASGSASSIASGSSGISIDPLTGLQALSVVTKLEEIGRKAKSDSKIKRQMKIGLEPNSYTSAVESTGGVASSSSGVGHAEKSDAWLAEEPKFSMSGTSEPGAPAAVATPVVELDHHDDEEDDLLDMVDLD